MFTALTALSISMIGNKYMWLEIVLWVFNMALYGSVICITSFKDGQIAYGIRQTNDKDREFIVKTGEFRELRIAEEYKAWKGFVHGFIATIPLIVLLIIHTIVIISDPETVIVGGIAGYIYLTFYAPFLFCSNVTAFTCYYALISIPLMTLFTGIPYILGARKSEKNYAKAFDLNNRIYGE